MKVSRASWLLAALAYGRHAVGSPVERVVELLKTLQKSIEDDGEREMQMYNKYTCWTDKVMKLKADAIDEARAKSKATARSILVLKGTISTLSSEIEELNNKIAENLKLQEEATAVRQKENAAFMAETSETKEAILAMEKAITVLAAGSTKSSALLQTQVQAASTAVRTALQALPGHSSLSLKPEKMALLTSFMQDVSVANYAPQSITVQGILRDMYETFTGDLESATQHEANANRNYEKLLYTMQTNVKNWQKEVATKENEKAEAETKLADNMQLYDELQAQIKADTAFFDSVKASGLAKFDEWNERKSLRAAELDGISKALEILSSDQARTLFESSIKPGKATPAGQSLLQVAHANADAATAAAGHAYNVLKAQATVTGSVRLGQLAVSVRLAKVGHFDKVIAAIDSMVAALQEEGEQDIQKRDQCKSEYQSLASSISDLQWKIKVNTATIDDLERSIAKSRAEREQTIADIQTVDQQMSDMTATRKEENGAFLQAKKEDEGAIDLLHKAAEAFTKYYKDNNIKMGPIQAGVKDLALAQAGPDFEISQWQAPEANFKSSGHHKNDSKDIVSILTMITEDLADEIRVAQKEEADSQTRYEAAMKDAQQLRRDLLDKKITLENMIAADEKKKADENIDKDNNEASLKDDQTYKANIKPDCDWIIGAFTERAKKRTAEMEGLTGAKEFLAGAQNAALVQQKPAVTSSFLRKAA